MTLESSSSSSPSSVISTTSTTSTPRTPQQTRSRSSNTVQQRRRQVFAANTTSPSTVLRQLSFVETTTATIMPSSSSSALSSSSSRQQGVLWKRRDVFKNRWRPRWFVLHPQQGILTYYLLTNDREAAALSNTSSHGSSYFASDTNNTAGPIVSTALDSSDVTTSSSPYMNRRRTFSETSNVSENSVDYDVVPRGTIFLQGGGCTVQINTQLTRPEENLYAFTIFSKSVDGSNTTSTNKCHLAARTAESRARWVQRISTVCRGGHSEEAVAAALTPDPQEQQQQQQQQLRLPETGSLRPVAAQSIEPSVAASSPFTSSSSPSNLGKWQRLDDAEASTKHVPAPVVAKIDELLSRYLPLCDNEEDDPAAGWTKLVNNDDNGHSGGGSDTAEPVQSWIRQDPLDQLQMIKSKALFHGHHPRTVLDLVLDSTKRKLYDTNIRNDERLQVCNPHVAMDYYSYQAVWPTSARDFAVVVHWQVLEEKQQKSDNNGDDGRAIVVLAFSCDESNQLKAHQPNHVRGNLKLTMTLLRPALVRGTISCHMTRLLSYDLCGSIPLRLTNAIMIQQSNLPRVIDLYLKRQRRQAEPSPLLSNGPLTNRDLVRDVVQPMLDATRPRRGRRISWDDEDQSRPRRSSSSNSLTMQDDNDASTPPCNAKTGEDDPLMIEKSNSVSSIIASSEQPDTISVHQPPSLLVIAAVLLAPVMINHFIERKIILVTGINKEWIFLATAWVVVRFVVLSFLGPPCRSASDQDVSQLVSIPAASMTCRFSVDLKGVLRFIAMQKEERDEQLDKDISVTHIVVCAMARAMTKLQKEQGWVSRSGPGRRGTRHVSLSWLWIHGDYQYPMDGQRDTINDDSGIDISVVSSSPSPLVTISQANKYRSVQDIANYLSFVENENSSSLKRTSRDGWIETWLRLVSPLVPLSSIIAAAPPLQQEQQYGQCVVLTSPDSSDHCGEVDIDVHVPQHQFTNGERGFQVVVVVSGVRLQPSDPPLPTTPTTTTTNTNPTTSNEISATSGLPSEGSAEQKQHSTGTSSTTANTKKSRNKKPTLSMSMTMQNVPLAQVHNCRQFAEHVQKLLQFPEMCDQ